MTIGEKSKYGSEKRAYNNCVRRSAFTLIELLVVIAIISVLAAILFPVFSQAKGAAKQTACLNNIKQLSLGVTLYSNDNDDFYPMGGWQSPPGDPSPALSRWYIDVAPYINNNQIRACPANSFYISEQGNWNSDYGINVSLAPWESAESAGVIVQPSNMLLLCDTAQMDFTQLPTSPDNLDPTTWVNWATGPTNYQVEGPYVFYPNTDYPYVDPPTPYGNNYRRPFALHHGLVNAGFCDGHAHSVDIRALIGPMPAGFALNDPRNLWSNSKS